MSIVDFEQAATESARVEKHRQNAMSSRLLLLRLRKHHYEYAPDSLKTRWVPSVIVGNPLITRAEKIMKLAPVIDPNEFPGHVDLEEYRTVKAGSIKLIISIVSRYYRVSIDELMSAGRTGRITMARNVAMYLAHEHTSHSVAGIGRALCRDHSTVVHGFSRISRLMTTDPDFAARLSIMRSQVLASGEMPTQEMVAVARQTRRTVNNRWDFDSRVQLIKEAHSGKTWVEIGKTFGVSMSAAFNAYHNMEMANRAFKAANA